MTSSAEFEHLSELPLPPLIVGKESSRERFGRRWPATVVGMCGVMCLSPRGIPNNYVEIEARDLTAVGLVGYEFVFDLEVDREDAHRGSPIEKKTDLKEITA